MEKFTHFNNSEDDEIDETESPESFFDEDDGTVDNNPIENLDRYIMVEELKKPIQNILNQLRGKLDNGEYQLVIGDDVSGRIPALILGRVIKDIYKSNSLDGPDLRFLAGSSGLDIKSNYPGFEYVESRKKTINKKINGIENFISNFYLNKELGKSVTRKVLLVTELIAGGRSFKILTEALRRCGVQYDIATIAMLNGEENEHKLEEELGCDVFVGYYSKNAHDYPRVYDQSSKPVIGLRKEDHELHSKKYPMSGGMHLYPKLRKQINEVREDSQDLASELSEWYKTKDLDPKKIRRMSGQAPDFFSE